MFIEHFPIHKNSSFTWQIFRSMKFIVIAKSFHFHVCVMRGSSHSLRIVLSIALLLSSSSSWWFINFFDSKREKLNNVERFLRIFHGKFFSLSISLSLSRSLLHYVAIDGIKCRNHIITQCFHHVLQYFVDICMVGLTLTVLWSASQAHAFCFSFWGRFEDTNRHETQLTTESITAFKLQHFFFSAESERWMRLTWCVLILLNELPNIFRQFKRYRNFKTKITHTNMFVEAINMKTND